MKSCLKVKTKDHLRPTLSIKTLEALFSGMNSMTLPVVLKKNENALNLGIEL